MQAKGPAGNGGFESTSSENQPKAPASCSCFKFHTHKKKQRLCKRKESLEQMGLWRTVERVVGALVGMRLIHHTLNSLYPPVYV